METLTHHSHSSLLPASVVRDTLPRSRSNTGTRKGPFEAGGGGGVYPELGPGTLAMG